MCILYWDLWISTPAQPPMCTDMNPWNPLGFYCVNSLWLPRLICYHSWGQTKFWALLYFVVVVVVVVFCSSRDLFGQELESLHKLGSSESLTKSNPRWHLKWWYWRNPYPEFPYISICFVITSVWSVFKVHHCSKWCKKTLCTSSLLIYLN